MNEKIATKLGEKMLNELYNKATPPTTWKKIIKKYSNTKIPFTELHYLPRKECEKILDKYKKKGGARWYNALAMLWLDYAPTSRI